MTTADPLPKAASFPPPERFKPKGTVKPGKRGRYRALVLALVHIAAAVHIGYWLAEGETVSPIEPSEAGETFEKGLVNAGFVLLMLAILSTLILGRWFCGWACHFVAYQDGCSWLLGKFGIQPTPIRSRALLLVPFFVAFEVFFREAAQNLYAGENAPEWQLALTKVDFWETFPGWVFGSLTILIAGFGLVFWLGSKGFCRYGCPYGAFFTIADRVSPMRIRVTDDCEHCGHCTAICTSDVAVHKEVAQFGQVVDPSCMKCMDCVATCPKDALYYGAGKPSFAKAAARSRKDLSLGEEILTGVVCLVAVLALRGAYGRVPFLLSVGLGVAVAFGAVALVRALTRKDFVVQNRIWRRAGSFTTRGRLAVLGLFVAVGLTAHTGYVRLLTWQGTSTWIEVNEELLAGAPSPDVQRKRFAEARPRLESAAESLRSARQAGLLNDPVLLRTLGLIERSLGDLDASEEALRAALGSEENWTLRLALSVVLQQTQRPVEAERVLRDGLEADRGRPELVLQLSNLLAVQYRFEEAAEVAERGLEERADARVVEKLKLLTLDLAELRSRGGDVEGARNALERVLELDPDNEIAKSRLESLGGASRR